MLLTELTTVVFLSSLAYAACRLYFRHSGILSGADAHAAQQYRMPSHRQAKYFTVAVTASVFLVCAASWLLAQALTDGIIDYVLHRELSLALAVAPDGQVFSTAADILVDKVRNRVAFPELYAGKGADIVTGNGAQGQLGDLGLITPGKKLLDSMRENWQLEKQKVLKLSGGRQPQQPQQP